MAHLRDKKGEKPGHGDKQIMKEEKEEGGKRGESEMQLMHGGNVMR